MKNCCEINANSKYSQCIRKSDKKIFKLPRKYSRKKCQEGIRGFTMRSSCAPWKDCIKKGGNMKINRKLHIMKNINNGNIQHTQGIRGKILSAEAHKEETAEMKKLRKEQKKSSQNYRSRIKKDSAEKYYPWKKRKREN